MVGSSGLSSMARSRCASPPPPCCRAGNRPSRGSRRCNHRRRVARPRDLHRQLDDQQFRRGSRRRKGGIRAAARALGLTRHRLGPHHRGLYKGCSGEHTYCPHSTRGTMAPFKPKPRQPPMTKAIDPNDAMILPHGANPDRRQHHRSCPFQKFSSMRICLLAPVTGYGHPRQAHRPRLALAEHLRRAIDRIDPT
jgi:hypothetical protein